MSIASIPDKMTHEIAPHINIKAPKSGSIQLAHAKFPNQFHPHHLNHNTYPGLYLVYETLIEKDLNDDYITLLAKNVSVSRDHVLIELDALARFSDQTPITAFDVVSSYQKFQTSLRPDLLLLCQKVHFSVINQNMLRIDFNIPLSNLWTLLSSIPIASNEHEFKNPPKGSGPYIYHKHDAHHITYRKNPHYWAQELPTRIGRYNFNEIQDTHYPSQYAVSQAFKNHKIDFYIEYSAQRWQHRKPNDTQCYKKLEHPMQRYQQNIWYNFKNPPLDDIRIRQAIHELIVPAFLNQWLFYGHYATHDVLDGNHQENIRQRMLTASKHLDKSHWFMQQDGYRYKQGQRLELNIITSHQQLDSFLYLLKTHLRRIGIKLNIEHLNHANYAFYEKHHHYHLLISPLSVDQNQKNNVHFLQYYDILPKLSSLYQLYPQIPKYLSYPILKSILQTLESQYVITPLWSLNCFRVGHHKKIHFIHHGQSFIDVHSFWQE
jgi:ABC-type transport system substrate-binding protein